MIEYLAASAGIGFVLGYLAAKNNAATRTDAPLHLVPAVRVNELVAERMAAGPADPFEQAEHWRMATAAFVTWASPLDFSRARVLAAGIVTRQGFDHLMGALRATGCVRTYAKSGSGWVRGYDKRRFLSELRRGIIQPPYPDLPAPQILRTRRGPDAQAAQPTQRAQPSRALVVWSAGG